MQEGEKTIEVAVDERNGCPELSFEEVHSFAIVSAFEVVPFEMTEAAQFVEEGVGFIAQQGFAKVGDANSHIVQEVFMDMTIVNCLG